MPHTWKLPYGDIVSDKTHAMYYRGQKIKEAYYRGECVWRKEEQGAKDAVRFWDWDGNLLLEMTADKFLRLNSYPDIHPDGSWTRDKFPNALSWWWHQGLSADGWTYTLEQAKEYVQTVGALDIAAVYNTPNNSMTTICWIETHNDSVECLLGYISTRFPECIIDWGDGTVETGQNISHVYANAGQYIIQIQLINESDDLPIGYYATDFLRTYLYGQNYYNLYQYYTPFIDGGVYNEETNQFLPNEKITLHAIYTGKKAHYCEFSLFGSKVMLIGMVRNADPFARYDGLSPQGRTSIRGQDGFLRYAQRLSVFTISPGCGYPAAAGTYSQLYWAYSLSGIIRNELYVGVKPPWDYVTVPLADCVSPVYLKRFFLPYGFTGIEHDYKSYISIPNPVPFFLSSEYPFAAVFSPYFPNKWADKPSRLFYPLSIQSLCRMNNAQQFKQDEIYLPISSVSSPYNHLISDETTLFVPKESEEYWNQYVSPSGKNRLEEGKIKSFN